MLVLQLEAQVKRKSGYVLQPMYSPFATKFRPSLTLYLIIFPHSDPRKLHTFRKLYDDSKCLPVPAKLGEGGWGEKAQASGMHVKLRSAFLKRPAGFDTRGPQQQAAPSSDSACVWLDADCSKQIELFDISQE